MSMETLAACGRLREGIRSRIMITGAALAGLLVVTSLTARADIVNLGRSDSYGVSADLTLVVPITRISVDADIAPFPVASGTAPAPYSITTNLASLNLAGGVDPGATVVTFSTAALEERAMSDVDGGPGSRTTSASSTINNLDLDLGILPTAFPGIEITAVTLNSSSTVMGDYGSLTAAGLLTVENLQIKVYGTLIFSITGTVLPNTMINLGTALVGASLILNEQILSGDGISSLALTVNAVNLRLTNTAFVGLNGPVSGQVIVEHSFAEQTAVAQGVQAVPESSTVVMAGVVGLFGLGYTWRRRRAA